MTVSNDLLTQSLTRLRHILEYFHPLEDEIFDELKTYFVLKKIKKSELIITQGQHVNEMYFIIEGLLRLYYVMQDGHEHTKAFYHDNAIVTSYTSLLTGQPSNLFADCLTDCTLLVGDYSKIRKLNDRYLNLQIVARKVAEHEFIKKDIREYQFLSMDAKERYSEFLKDHGKIQSLIPHKYIASYLGIRSETLSRIKKT